MTMVKNIVDICYQLGTFNYRQSTHQNNHNINITCRLCNQVLSSFQAFKAHIESHFAHQNHTKRGIYSSNLINYSQREMIPSPLQLNIPRPVMMQRTKHFVNNGNFHSSPQQPKVISQPGRNSFPQLIQVLHCPPNRQKEMEVSPSDGTKPFINLLEKPINDNKFINWANLNCNILDLALRL
ncbi:hypothetical protein VNO77_14624 [Canavalia gladiata]|uniref:C2H2-type domain-containing protein n=1 Tax=Canavalia gladiata TaxID=3824 RepID=A0AAN9LYV6_CANGL